jgi:hypothetical protein
MPPGEAQCASAPSLLRINADTSQSLPTVLRREVTLPIGKTPLWDPLQLPRLFSETSRSTPKNLIPELVLPSGKRQVESSPAPVRILPDTSSGTSLSLKAVVPPKPIFNQPLFAPVKYWFQPDDTSAGSAKVLLPEVNLPVGDQVYVGPQKYWFQPDDTSFALPLSLLPTAFPPGEQVYIGPQKLLYQPADTSFVLPQPAPVVFPVGEQVYVSPARYFFQPDDTSTGSAKVLVPEASLPIGDQVYVGPQKVWFQPTDSSKSFPFWLQPTQMPVGEQVYVSPARYFFQPADTSTSAYQTTHPLPPVPPGEQVYVSPAKYFFQPADTSTAAYQTLHPFVSTPLPAGKQSSLPPQRYIFQPAPTDASAYAAQKFVQQPNPPGKVSFVAAPRHVWQVQNTSTSAYPTLYPPVPFGSSGTSCITITRDSMIASSLRLLHVLQDDQVMSANQIATGAEDLNTLITNWQSRGLQLWTYQWLPIPLVAGQNAYTIGPSGANVTSVRPLRLMLAGSYVHSISGYDRDVKILSRSEYAQIVQKGYQDTATAIYYDSGINSGSTTSPSTGHGTLYVYSNAMNSTDIVVCNFQRPIYVMTAGTDEFDFPCEWYLALRYGLAVMMADQYEVPQSRLRRLAKQASKYHKDVQEWSVENAGFQFLPDQRLDNPWGGWT